MNKRVVVEGVPLVLLDANHCPGAAMFLFYPPALRGKAILHVGDFRWCEAMKDVPELRAVAHGAGGQERLHSLYLDTTCVRPLLRPAPAFRLR